VPRPYDIDAGTRLAVVLSPSSMAAKRAFWTLVALLVAATPAGAGPEIQIHAHTQITFDGMGRGYDGRITAVGALRDKLTGDAIANQRITLRLDGEVYDAFTDDSGKFAVALPPMTGPHDLVLAFSGSSLLDPSELTVKGVEVDKQPVELQLTTVPITGGVQVVLTATSQGNPVSIRATIRAGAADADPGTLPVLGEVTSGNTINVLRKDAGGAGRRRVRAIFAGDPVYAAAQAETTFELKTATRTTFNLSSKKVAFEDRVSGSGKVVDEDGKGVARAPVTVLTESRQLEQTSTKSDGTFKIGFEAKLLGTGTHPLQAVVDVASPFLSPSRSDPVVVEIAPEQPVPITVTAAAFIITALVAAGFFIARSRPWDRRRKQQPPAERPAATDDKGEVKGGLTQAKPGLVSTLRRASDVGISGTIRDAVRGRPVPGAVVRVRLGGGSGTQAVAEHRAVAGDDGSFAIENLTPGEWKAKVIAAGHVSERFTLTVPHRGELRGVRVDLVPVREQVFSLYRVAAQPELPEARLWGVWSPRQIVDHVRRQRPRPALAELTNFVEEAYFSARVPDEDVLPSAQDHVDRAVRERAGAHAPRPPAV
jgi:hypothetical protein